MDNIENNVPLIKSLNHQDPVRYSGDGKLVTKLQSNHSRKHIDAAVHEIQTDENGHFRMERTRSVPEIVRANVERRCESCTPEDSLSDFRDASTNT